MVHGRLSQRFSVDLVLGEVGEIRVIHCAIRIPIGTSRVPFVLSTKTSLRVQFYETLCETPQFGYVLNYGTFSVMDQAQAIVSERQV
jgi:hypothetical protein